MTQPKPEPGAEPRPSKLEVLNQAFTALYLEVDSWIVDDLRMRFNEYLAEVVKHEAERVAALATPETPAPDNTCEWCGGYPIMCAECIERQAEQIRAITQAETPATGVREAQERVIETCRAVCHAAQCCVSLEQVNTNIIHRMYDAINELERTERAARPAPEGRTVTDDLLAGRAPVTTPGDWSSEGVPESAEWHTGAAPADTPPTEPDNAISEDILATFCQLLDEEDKGAEHTAEDMTKRMLDAITPHLRTCCVPHALASRDAGTAK
jgi:hypothetical protein